jgi:hypothetical protein
MNTPTSHPKPDPIPFTSANREQIHRFGRELNDLLSRYPGVRRSTTDLCFGDAWESVSYQRVGDSMQFFIRVERPSLVDFGYITKPNEPEFEEGD